jgi:phospholipid transport system substrate-binding protein
MPTRRSVFLVFAVVGLLWSSAALTYADDATSLVKRTTETMLKTLEARRAEVDRDPSLIFGMIESGVAPHFDFERITQGAVGQSWRDASPSQRSALVDGFKRVLIRTYARSILSYSNEEIRYLPVKPGRQPSSVTVSTEILSPGAAPIPVDYRMHSTAGAWKVYDVVINNASLVGNYRTSFSTEIRQSGIDGLVAKLEEMNTSTRP